MDGSFWSWSWGGRRRGPAAGDDAVSSPTDSATQMAQDVEQLKHRLAALEAQAPGELRAVDDGNPHVAGRGDDAASDRAVAGGEESETAPAKKSIAWRDHAAGNMSLDRALGEDDGGDDDGDDDRPMRNIKFRGASPRVGNNLLGDGDGDGDGDSDSDEDSSAYSSDEDPIAFAGWARVFFQSRRDCAATQVRAPGAPGRDSYLHLTIRTTANELRISAGDDHQRLPPLIDPPIPLRHFFAARVPGSRSGAALFPRRDDRRRLRKYVLRFEFRNQADAHQPPGRYAHFSRSGAVAKNSLTAMHKMRRAMARRGEERREQLQQNRRRGQDAFAAHLASLDDLLRESDDLAERFVECVNARNEEEDLARMSDVGHGIQRKRITPLPPYWGSGYNRPDANKDELDDDEGDSESDDSEEEEELDYDDDDETAFDKVKVSTEQTLESLWKHIVK